MSNGSFKFRCFNLICHHFFWCEFVISFFLTIFLQQYFCCRESARISISFLDFLFFQSGHRSYIVVLVKWVFRENMIFRGKMPAISDQKEQRSLCRQYFDAWKNSILYVDKNKYTPYTIELSERTGVKFLQHALCTVSKNNICHLTHN